jgi:pimeloyl-[acyl-carrier protein] methyl ester esterase
MGEVASVRKLVLLPGMDGTGRLFGPFIEALPLGLEALPVSYPTDRSLSYAELAALVRARLPVSEPFGLLAESFSTPIAIQIAAANPAGLKALILVAGFATNPTYPSMNVLSPLFFPSFKRGLFPRFFIERYLLGANAPTALVEAVQQAVQSVSSEVLASRLKLILACDSRADLARITVPILYVQAIQDRIVPSRCLNEIVAVRPHVAVARIDGPHLLLQREPQKSAEMIAHFIQQLG